jgi:hypothetical protein
VLDYISDIGGLQGMIFSIFAIIIGLANYNMFDNYIVTKLFRVESPQNDDDDESPRDKKSRWKRTQFIDHETTLFPCKEFIKKLLPSWILCICCCSGKTRTEKAL